MRDLTLARRLGKQLARDEASPVEIMETAEAAFDLIELQNEVVRSAFRSHNYRKGNLRNANARLHAPAVSL